MLLRPELVLGSGLRTGVGRCTRWWWFSAGEGQMSGGSSKCPTFLIKCTMASFNTSDDRRSATLYTWRKLSAMVHMKDWPQITRKAPTAEHAPALGLKPRSRHIDWIELNCCSQTVSLEYVFRTKRPSSLQCLQLYSQSLWSRSWRSRSKLWAWPINAWCN